jgi:hypothetical protein
VQLILTFPANPFTDFTSRRNTPNTPRLIVSDAGLAVSVKPVTGKLTSTGFAML